MAFPLSFDQPLALLLLPVVLAVVWAASRHSHAPLDVEQIRQTRVVRAILVTLVVVALAQPHWRVLSHDLTVMYLLDLSDSMRPDQRAAANRFITNSLDARGGGDRAGVVTFGRYPNLETQPSSDPKFTGSHAAVASDATSLQDAIKSAEAAFPTDTGKKIVLLTDGKENAGDAAAEVAALKEKGIQVDVAPVGLDASQSPETSVDSVRLPAHVEKDAPFAVRVVVSSSVAQDATVKINRDGVQISATQVALHAGKNIVALTGRETMAGAHRYEAVVVAAKDTVSQNNHAFGVTNVHGTPRVLYIASSGSSTAGVLRAALAAQGVGLDVRAPANSPKSVAEWQAYDSVVISDVASTDFSPDQMTSLATSVKDFGTGLGMVGGLNSFGSGLYNDTPIEAALPVDMRVPEKKRVPPVAVVIVLDASGSMSATEGGVQKVQLAAQAAVNLMKSLQPDDEVAVIAVTEQPTVVVPLQAARKAKEAAKLINGLEAGGGGIACKTGLQAAYSMLEATKFPTRHVIMCADTTDSEEQEGCADMARVEFVSSKITTSMIGIGESGDPHVPFQKSVAAAGHGQMQAVSRASDLPRMFARDVQTIKASLFVEKPFRPIFNPTDPVLGGVPFASEPPLLGYNIVTPKSDATVALTVPGDRDTLMAYRQYGLGRTFAFTSDDRAHWAAQWVGWGGFNQFWAQTVRWSLKNEVSAGLQTSVDRDAGRGHIAVDAFTPTGDFVDGASLSAVVVGSDQKLTRLTLNQTAPGRYEGAFDADQSGLYLVNVRDNSRPGVSQSAALAVPYSPEYQNSPPNTVVLSALTSGTGGKFLTRPVDVFRNTRLWDVAVVALTPGLLVIASGLLLLDVAWRRLGWKVKRRAKAISEEEALLADAELADAPDGMATHIPHGSMTGAVVQRPLLRQTTERTASGYDDGYLTRSASSRIGDDEDAYPFVAKKGQ